MVHNCLVLKRLWRQFPPCIISQKYPFYDFLLLLLNSFEGAWARDKSFQNNWSFFLTEKKFWPPCPERLLIFTYKNFMTNHHKLWKKSHLTKKKQTFNIFSTLNEYHSSQNYLGQNKIHNSQASLVFLHSGLLVRILRSFDQWLFCCFIAISEQLL